MGRHYKFNPPAFAAPPGPLDCKELGFWEGLAQAVPGDISLTRFLANPQEGFSLATKWVSGPVPTTPIATPPAIRSISTFGRTLTYNGAQLTEQNSLQKGMHLCCEAANLHPCPHSAHAH